MRHLIPKPRLETVIGLLIAIPILIILGIYVPLFVRSMVEHPELKQFRLLLYLWQTQVGAIFAIIAAGIAATVVLLQISAERRLDETRRLRRASALRAVLPLALTELSDYATNCARTLATLLQQPNSLSANLAGKQFPPLPAGLVGRLMEFIEVSEPNHARPLIVLAKRVQIQHARIRDTQQGMTNQHGSILYQPNLSGRLIDTAEIFARCGALYKYARGNAAAPAAAISPDEVKSALIVMRIELSDMSEIERTIDRYAAHDHDGGPWPEV
jgi:hypothetical protein